MLSLVIHIGIYKLGVCPMYKCREVMFGLYISLNAYIICFVHSYILYIFIHFTSFNLLLSNLKNHSRQFTSNKKDSNLLTLMRKFKFYLLKIMVYFSVVYFVNRGRRHVYVMESHHSFNACRSMNTIDFFKRFLKRRC